MPFILTKGRRRFLGFDKTGKHQWVQDRLDAVRFDRRQEVPLTEDGTKIVKVDSWDGHYEAYNGHEIQVYRDTLRGKHGGKRWRFRIGLINSERPEAYTLSKQGYTLAENAMREAKRKVDQRGA